MEYGKISLKEKNPNEDANIVIPIPVTCCEAPKYTEKIACISQKIAPTKAAIRIPEYKPAP